MHWNYFNGQIAIQIRLSGAFFTRVLIAPSRLWAWLSHAKRVLLMSLILRSGKSRNSNRICKYLKRVKFQVLGLTNVVEKLRKASSHEAKTAYREPRFFWILRARLSSRQNLRRGLPRRSWNPSL